MKQTDRIVGMELTACAKEWGLGRLGNKCSYCRFLQYLPNLDASKMISYQHYSAIAKR